jgi:hypothetical protein
MSLEVRACVPDFIAVWVPFILGTFRKPAEQPMRAPPGKTRPGTACKQQVGFEVRISSYIPELALAKALAFKVKYT